MKRMTGTASAKRRPCLTEISTGALALSAAVLSALLWLAIGAVI
jgi:hypothetical protein